MSTTDKAVEILRSTLTELEASLDGKKNEIKKAYNDAVATANKAQKDALAIATKTKNEAEAQFTTEKAEITKLQSAIKVLTGESTKTPKATKASPGQSGRVSDWNGKISTALKHLKKTIADNPTPGQVRDAVKQLNPDITFTGATFNSAWITYKKKNQSL